MDPYLLVLLVYPPIWWFFNKYFYGPLYGRRLKTRWVWAVHGALLFRQRCKEWERDEPDLPKDEWLCAGCMAATQDDLKNPCPGTHTGDHVTL